MKLKNWQLFAIVFCAFVVLGAPFKVMVLVEGLTEVRPVNGIPPVAGLLAGPVGALACGLGNVAADLFGTFDATSILGLAGNFCAAFVPYRLWHIYSLDAPNVHKGKNILLYIQISLSAALTVAWICGFGLYYVFGLWIESIYTYIFFNNLGFSIVLGLPLFIMLTSREVQVLPFAAPKRYVLLKNARLRRALPVVYTALMLVLCVGVVGFHLTPAASSLFTALSAVCALGLIAIVF